MHSQLLGHLAFLTVAVISLALSASGQPCSGAYLSPAYKKWLNEDVHWIITTKERKEFLSLVTDDQCSQFIAEFWERRNHIQASGKTHSSKSTIVAWRSRTSTSRLEFRAGKLTGGESTSFMDRLTLLRCLPRMEIRSNKSGSITT